MTPDFSTMLEGRLRDFRAWLRLNEGRLVRLVKFSGVQFVGAIDVPPDEIEDEIVGAISEGWNIDWGLHDDRVVLRVWEYPGPEPTWEQTLAERDLFDIGRLLSDLTKSS